MKRKTLLIAVVAAGLVMAATSAAFSINPIEWFLRPNKSTTQAGPAVVLKVWHKYAAREERFRLPRPVSYSVGLENFLDRFPDVFGCKTR